MSDTYLILQKMADQFRDKIGDRYSIIAQFDIQATGDTWHLSVEPGKSVTISEGPCDSAQYRFSVNPDTLMLIASGGMTGMTAAAKASGTDRAPLDLQLAEGMELTPEVRSQLYTFMQHFFNPTTPEKILLGREHARPVHGAPAVALYYAPGFRSAWYTVKKGERLNEPGDTNPFPQAFVIIEGGGSAKIGESTLEVKAGESYYIPPGSDHVLWTDSDNPLVVIWLAWGEGA